MQAQAEAFAEDASACRTEPRGFPGEHGTAGTERMVNDLCPCITEKLTGEGAIAMKRRCRRRTSRRRSGRTLTTAQRQKHHRRQPAVSSLRASFAAARRLGRHAANPARKRCRIPSVCLFPRVSVVWTEYTRKS